MWDFGAGNEQDIVYLEVVNTSSGVTPEAVGSANLQYSDDGSAFTTLMPYTGSVGSLTMQSATWLPPATGSAALSSPVCSIEAFSGGCSSVSAPSPTTSSFGASFASATLPKPTISSFSGSQAALTLPSGTLVCSGHDSTGEQAAYLSMPSPMLFTSTGANASGATPSPTLTSAGTVTALGSVAAQLPTPVLVSSGSVSGTSNAALRAPIATLVGYSGAVCSVSVTGHPTLQATGTTGSIGGAQLTCPLFELTAGATAQNHGSANLLAPSPRMGQTAQAWLVAPGAQLTAIGSAVVTVTYEAYATNLKHNPRPGVEPHDEVTHYTNFPFTHVVRYQNSYYGANSTGLYLLEGTTDDAVPITWTIKTATTDFKSQQNKTVASAYLGGHIGPDDTVTLFAGEGASTVAYAYTTPRGSLAQNYRQVFGRGVKTQRYYALGLSGNGELELDDISLDVHNLSRRI